MTVLSCFTCSKRRTQARPVDMVEVYVRVFVTTLCSEFEANFLANFSIMMYAHHTPHAHTTSLTDSHTHTHSTIQPPLSASQAQEATTSCLQVPVRAVNPTTMHSHRAVLGLWNPSLPPGPNSPRPLDALSVRLCVCVCLCVCGVCACTCVCLNYVTVSFCGL